MRYHSGSGQNLSDISIVLLARKLEIFQKTHKDKLKFEATIAGAKIK
ncbi:hypothetical protein F406_gp116 [Agrobacterium phage 7-7-1]|uniref:Uncharacterized protein n=1 Tax=Agrobacterium phage 7-7-1 TaxID=1161931 RepID=J7FA55_9CAUD|nr:hypothetical protein F406_gp116 [Agrobacterium phage 7-7-1]AFH19699.1 hypothetical protein 7-7-1_0001 [Agrobacterium phage 7-7-1]